MFKKFILLVSVAMSTTIINAGPVIETLDVVGSSTSNQTNSAIQVVTHSDLQRTGKQSIGEILRNAPGVTATGYSNMASRPVIRGLDVDRVQILNNSVLVLDASSISYDHAPGLGTAQLSQIEIFKGPSALLYSSSSTGGVVNVVDNRISRKRLQEAEGYISFGYDGRTYGGDTSVIVEGNSGSNTWHIDAAYSDQGSLRTPAFTDPEDKKVTLVKNTQFFVKQNGIGYSSVQEDNSFWGISFDSYATKFGVPKEPVSLDLLQTKLSISGNQFIQNSSIDLLRFRLVVNSYRHFESEDSVVSGIFRNSGVVSRIEMQQISDGNLDGVFGFQVQSNTFSNTGEHILLTSYKEEALSFFFNESLQVDTSIITIGARYTDVHYATEKTLGLIEHSDEHTHDTQVSLLPIKPSKRFYPLSLSLKFDFPISDQDTVSLLVTSSQRAPSPTELYIDGLHEVTGTYELGNPNQKIEKGLHVEFNYSLRSDKQTLDLALFRSDYNNFIFLRNSFKTVHFHVLHGEVVHANIPRYDYVGSNTIIQGFELLFKSITQNTSEWNFIPEFYIDGLTSKVGSNGRLPRLTPTRVAISLITASQEIRIAPVVRFFSKVKPGLGETRVTDSFSTFDFEVSYTDESLHWFVSLNNLANALAFQANTIEQVRYYSPIAGRSIHSGISVKF
ncbi:MAG: TonB-dependent receptor [Methylacidiphilales bacterium]|nr:TonB-dependent receptor [Candidatus Methylacidiphilales bacterium]